MSMLTLKRHPSFDALSAHADAGAVPGVGTRVGRHVARCAECRAVIDEIRTLGDAARGMEVESAPPELWARIEAGAGTGAQDAPPMRDRELPPLVVDADRMEQPTSTQAGPSTTRATTATKRGLRSASIALGLVLAVALTLLWPSRATLNATAMSRLTFSPSRPVPGGTLVIHYRAPAWLQGAPKLVLAGQFAAEHRAWQPIFWGVGRELDSLATLVPTADGSYEARLRLPPNFLGARLVVFDSAGMNRDAGPAGEWIVIGGKADGSPSLVAFLTMYEPLWRDADGRPAAAGHVFVADSIQRYFPGHPAGWALYDRFGTSRGVFDFLSFFRSAERKYASLDEALWPKQTLDAEREVAMVQLASKIEEPAEETKWAMRLAHDHPEDPRALGFVSSTLHSIELREPPHFADSIRQRLPLLDSLYRSSHPQPIDVETDPYGNPPSIVQRYGDSATKALWATRAFNANNYFTIGQLRGNLDASSEAAVLADLRRGCDRPAGKFPMPDLQTWQRWCSFDRSLTWSYLSKSHLARGQAREAVAFADSSVAAQRPECGSFQPYLARANARIALGDTAGARSDFEIEYGRRMPSDDERARIASALGARFDAVAFEAASDSVRRASLACFRAGRRERRQRDSAAVRERAP